MFLDFSWVAEPTAWGGLGTLILLEVVLGIDNLVFISILSSRLPEDKRRHAFTIGLSLALIMRLGLLSTVAWLIGLTKPWFSLFGYSFTARDIILLIGGLFLLLKGTMELHERLEGFQPTEDKAVHQAVFWQVITQIVVLDAIFSLDSIITSVGMVKELSIMMLAVIIAVLAMPVGPRAVDGVCGQASHGHHFVPWLLADDRPEPYSGRAGLSYSQGIPLRGHRFFDCCGSLQPAGATEPKEQDHNARIA